MKFEDRRYYMNDEDIKIYENGYINGMQDAMNKIAFLIING